MFMYKVFLFQIKFCLIRFINAVYHFTVAYLVSKAQACEADSSQKTNEERYYRIIILTLERASEVIMKL